jgi:8-oxo-dGTP diphosphatase
MLTVVAAIIEKDGKILACQRKAGGAFGLMWEFPGGKKEPGESPSEALARELREELGVEARIGAEVYRSLHQYAEMPEPIELIFFAASADPLQMRNLIFEKVEWRTPASLAELDFLPADRELIAKIANGTLHIKSNSPSG